MKTNITQSSSPRADKETNIIHSKDINIFASSIADPDQVISKSDLDSHAGDNDDVFSFIYDIRIFIFIYLFMLREKKNEKYLS